MNNKEWKIAFLKEALKELDNLDGSVRNQVIAAIHKVAKNPLPITNGGYGKPLGNKHGMNLTSFLKIKLKKSGIRIVYKLEYDENIMMICVISIREDETVYRIASKR